MWWFDSNKTKQNKTKHQAPSFLQIQVLILKACFPSTVAFYEEMCGFFFFFLICFLFFFFLEKIPKNEGNRLISWELRTCQIWILHQKEGSRRKCGKSLNQTKWRHFWTPVLLFSLCAVGYRNLQFPAWLPLKVIL